MVWAETRKLGLAVGKINHNGNDGWFSVFHYEPAGNIVFMGDENRLFHKNVRPLKESVLPILAQDDQNLQIDKLTARSETSELDIEHEELANLALVLHNELRDRHLDTGSLVIDADCCKTAQYVADLKARELTDEQFSAGPDFVHSRPDQRKGYGENIAYTTHPSKRKAVEVAIEGFYAEIEDYNWSNPTSVPAGKQVGHFTQVSSLLKILCLNF